MLELRFTAAVGSCWFGPARAIPGRSAGDIPVAGWSSPTRPHTRLDRVSVARSKVSLNARIARVHPKSSRASSLMNEVVDVRTLKVTADRCGGASGAMDGPGRATRDGSSVPGAPISRHPPRRYGIPSTIPSNPTDVILPSIQSVKVQHVAVGIECGRLDETVSGRDAFGGAEWLTGADAFRAVDRRSCARADRGA